MLPADGHDVAQHHVRVASLAAPAHAAVVLAEDEIHIRAQQLSKTTALQPGVVCTDPHGWGIQATTQQALDQVDAKTKQKAGVASSVVHRRFANRRELIPNQARWSPRRGGEKKEGGLCLPHP